MLVLTRKKSETIHIGDNIVVKVISTGRGKVKIGIEAPEQVRVMRSEVLPAFKHSAEAVSGANAELPGSTTPADRIARIRQAMSR